MAKEKLKYVYDDVLSAVDYNYTSVLEISQKAKVSWEATKNCLEVLEYINIIKKDDNKNTRYKKRLWIDLEKVGGLL